MKRDTAPSSVKLSGTQLNKLLSNAGVASRRKCADIIREGRVKVNGRVIIEPGYRVTERDTVTYNGKKLESKKKYYVLLNKPKDHLTTTSDDRGRKTVMELIERATSERLYPVGRLDRNTTGVLLFTNDGELAQKLSHLSGKVKKVYEVCLNKPLALEDMEKVAKGIELEDGIAQVDAIAYADPKDNRIVGIELHSGKNRIVRRIFEHLGYDVVKLDRVLYAGLTKKNLQRGQWRHLTPKEINWLKRLRSS